MNLLKPLLWVLLSTTWLSAATSPSEELVVPAITGYVTPEEASYNRDVNGGTVSWNDPEIKFTWFGEFNTAGEVSAALRIKVPARSNTKLKLSFAGGSKSIEINGKEGASQTVDFGRFHITKAGYFSIVAESLNLKGQDTGKIEALLLAGPPIASAHFNLKERRNASSVHLKYIVEPNEKISAFYNEATAVTDPLATYYSVCGFSVGYFGMQINSPTERRIIFSVWDAGTSNAATRDSVDPKNYTQLIAKGEDVISSSFGYEGTGGHSHLVYPWKTGEPQKFLVTAKPEGNTTTYSGYYFHPEKKKWVLIASFKRPDDGKYLKGLYSFCEDFGGSNSFHQRKALYGPQWVCNDAGTWTPILKASFSHDPTGKADRLDRFMGIENGQFFLSNGGFMPGTTTFGEVFTRPASGQPPGSDLPIVKPGN